MQTEDKLAFVIAAQANSVAIGERPHLGGLAVNKDAIALPSILNQQTAGADENRRASARDAHVVEGQVVAIFFAPSDEERKLLNGDLLQREASKHDFDKSVDAIGWFEHRLWV
jgi:hypothetical protein